MSSRRGERFGAMITARKIVISGLGTGFLPAGGTFASLAVCLLYVLLCWSVTLPEEHSSLPDLPVNILMFLLFLVTSVACLAMGGAIATKIFGSKDPRQCTLDEWAGMSLALLFMPLDPQHDWTYVVAAAIAFVAFRFFDILKPPPIRQLERLPGGWGVLMDDVAAGLAANIVTQLVLRVGLGL